MSHSEGSPPLCINRRHRQGPGVKGGPAALVFLQHRGILITAQTRKASRESSRFGQLCVSVLTEERTNVTQPPFSSLRGTQVGGEGDEASSLTRAQLTEVNKTGTKAAWQRTQTLAHPTGKGVSKEGSWCRSEELGLGNQGGFLHSEEGQEATQTQKKRAPGHQTTQHTIPPHPKSGDLDGDLLLFSVSASGQGHFIII